MIAPASTTLKCELYNDSFQNWKSYGIPKAQLLIADIPYNIQDGFAYGSSPEWYKDGDNKNGESDKAKTNFFYADGYFRIPEFMFFCSRMLKKEPKAKNEAPCMIVFCAFQQIQEVIEEAKKNELKKYIPLVFVKPSSPQVLKANMKIVGATEYAVVLYRDKLPKFRNNNQMIKNWFPWLRDGANIPKLHSTQKPIMVLKRLIEIFTDVGDVVIDPCAGSGSTLRAAKELGRNAYGFEISKEFYNAAQERMLSESCSDGYMQIDGQISIFDGLEGIG